jgi:IS5 family transposase
VYKAKDRQTEPLFKELFPFGGKLDGDNRWLKISKLIPWDNLENSYSQHFSTTGRPGVDSRLAIGLLLLKHMTGTSDREIVQLVSENPYMQAFCGLDNFTAGKSIDPSTLTNVRKRLGKKRFKELEDLTYKHLIELKIIKAKGMLVDATVFPENIRYPTDAGLLNEARQWLVDKIKSIGGKIGKKYRTYCRTARQEYLNFNKNKRKTKKDIKHIRKSMLQFVRRNVRQFEEVLTLASEQGVVVAQKVTKRLTVVKELLAQQWYMHRENVKRIEDRIVSLHKPQVRPIKRGKAGKDVEFGPKASLSHVGAFTFLDRLSSDNFNESGDVALQLANYEELFGVKPPYIVGDRIYGTKDNRKLLKDEEIRDAFEPRGRKPKDENTSDHQWRKRKRKERNRIEGAFGHFKNHFGLDRIKYSIEGGDELWVRLGLMAANLKTAVANV